MFHDFFRNFPSLFYGQVPAAAAAAAAAAPPECSYLVVEHVWPHGQQHSHLLAGGSCSARTVVIHLHVHSPVFTVCGFELIPLGPQACETYSLPYYPARIDGMVRP